MDEQERVIGTDEDWDFNWSGNENLTVHYYGNDVGIFEFNDIIHPLSQVNIAILLAIELYMGEWEMEWQNNYCISEYKNGSMTIRLSYDLNEQNYPTLMKTRYGANNESLPSEYMSFEYEAY